jgi:hypothetical protein
MEKMIIALLPTVIKNKILIQKIPIVVEIGKDIKVCFSIIYEENENFINTFKYIEDNDFDTRYSSIEDYALNKFWDILLDNYKIDNNDIYGGYYGGYIDRLEKNIKRIMTKKRINYNT